MAEEERREILEKYKRGEIENTEEEEEDDKEDLVPPYKNSRRRAVGWVNKKWEKRNLKKIERTYQREAEEGYKIVHIVIPVHKGLTSIITWAEREREKRKELLEAEEKRKKMRDYSGESSPCLKKWTHQKLKEERERMKEQYLKDKQEKWLEQMNLEADEQIHKFSTQYITRCPTTQHSHDYNQGQELPG
ncbi:vicilin-like seed storage protein At2g18540 [Salmo trutta]|uniref:vicilin-like seed storage protein At2g18540 n=1 Tax=Salmo trutta TaxID=8032 RepID=UPI00113263F4|nr:vicilin-like seed storage protein At2g18540 [Salmo trutta]